MFDLAVTPIPADECDVVCDVMPRSLALPDAPHEQFDNPPLKVMLGQVRFPTILKIADLGSLAPFQEELRKEYSEFSEERQVSLAIGPDGAAQTGDAKNYRFATSDGEWSIVLNPTFLTLEASVATKYTDYGEFRERFGRVWAAALRHLGPGRIVQQGLRYIDHFDWDDVGPTEWSRYINASLLGLLGTSDLAARLEHMLTDTRMALDDGAALAFKYGLVRSGPENVLGFLMDTDCFNQVPTDEVDVDAVLQRFDLYHDEIHVLFRWAVTPEAIERFRRARG